MSRRPLPQRRAGRQSTSRAAKKRRATFIGAAFIGFVAIVWGGFYGYGMWTARPQTDNATFCPITGPLSYTAVIIDTTDSINAIQKQAIENELKIIRQSIPRDGALAFYAAGFTGDISRPEFALCNPGHADEINAVNEGTRRAQIRWRDGFEKPLQDVLAKMLVTTPSQSTPLLEAIQSVSVLSFGPLRANEKTSAKPPIPKRLVIISDLLQHSNNLSLYSKPPSLEQYLKSEAYRKVRADLRDIDVQILLIRRQTKQNAQSTDLTNFWESLIPAQGGRIVHFKPLEG